jgi:hypothetical protein
LEATTASNVELPLEAGQTIGLEFGSRIRQDVDTVSGESGNTETPDTGDSGPSNGDSSISSITIIGIALLVVAVLLLGAILVLLLRR